MSYLANSLEDVSSDNLSGADNQQGSREIGPVPVSLTPQRLHAELLEADVSGLEASSKETSADRSQDEDIVHASWRHGDSREQGSRTGRCGWITSFLRSS